MFPKSYELRQVRFLARDFRYFCYPPYSFCNMTHIQKEFLQVACRYPASYRHHKKVRNLFLTLTVKAMYCTNTVKQSLYRGFQEVRVPRFHDS